MSTVRMRNQKSGREIDVEASHAYEVLLKQGWVFADPAQHEDLTDDTIGDEGESRITAATLSLFTKKELMGMLERKGVRYSPAELKADLLEQVKKAYGVV